MGANAKDNDRGGGPGGGLDSGDGCDHSEAVGSTPVGVHVVAASVVDTEPGTGDAADISGRGLAMPCEGMEPRSMGPGDEVEPDAAGGTSEEEKRGGGEK